VKGILLAGFLAALLFPGKGFSQENPDAPVVAGKVEFIEGIVQFYDRQRRARVPRAGDPVYEGDSIVTGTDGEVHFTLEDGGFIAVRPNTKMRIVNFRAQGDEEDKLNIGLLEGSFRSMTGWIARFSRGNYLIRTPTATIGVRGTDHEPFHIPEGSSLGEPGTYDKVNEGGTVLTTKYGRVEVTPGKSGFAHLRRAEPPRALERPPAFFKPTRNEARFAGRQSEIQRSLQQRRDERRKAIEQRRAPQREAQKAEARPAQKSRLEERNKALEQRRKAIEARQKAIQERRNAAEQRRRELKQQRKAAPAEAAKRRREND